jgi:hypothetical protein
MDMKIDCKELNCSGKESSENGKRYEKKIRQGIQAKYRKDDNRGKKKG